MHILKVFHCYPPTFYQHVWLGLTFFLLHYYIITLSSRLISIPVTYILSPEPFSDSPTIRPHLLRSSSPAPLSLSLSAGDKERGKEGRRTDEHDQIGSFQWKDEPCVRSRRTTGQERYTTHTQTHTNAVTYIDTWWPLGRFKSQTWILLV